MGCGASKVSNQTVSPVVSEAQKESNNNDKTQNNDDNVLASSPNSSTPTNSDENQNSTSQNDSTNESPSDKSDTSPSPSSNANENEGNQLKKSSTATLIKSNSKNLLFGEKNNKEENKENKRTGSESSLYLKEKSSNILNDKYGNNRKGLSQSSSEATLTNQNSSDSIGKLSSSFVPLPAIEPRTTLKSISFEIPLDESMICRTIRPSFKGNLPKLHISQDELKRKIGNVDSKWKDMNVTKNGYKKKGPVDEEKLKALKKRLLEKEAEAALNRQRELDKLKAKLEKAQKHALKVQERKRKLEAEWLSKSKSNLEMQSNIDYIS